ncbi:MAG: alpha/beta fold hydrolase [Deltaproteobacteria bacterium]|nr:MAG: alpha/beta fold hydrolase [Deltaproteobacteria bacterium]
MISIAGTMPQRDARVPAAEPVEFASRRGNMLVGDLHRPEPANGTTLVLCHGMESTRHGNKQRAIVERFGPAGYTILRFDFSYVGDSEGSFEDLTISGEVDDLIGALDFLDEFGPARRILVGSSLGGAVALLAAAGEPERVAGVATIAAVGDTALFTRDLDAAEIESWRRRGSRPWRDGSINVSFLDDVERLDILAAVARIRCPLLVMHGRADSVVPPEHASAIAAAAGGPVRLEMFDGVGHRFEEPGALEALLDVLERWLGEIAAPLP